MLDDGRNLTPGKGQKIVPYFDKLTESISGKALELQSVHPAQLDFSAARPFVIAPMGPLASLQANNSLVAQFEPLYIARPGNPVEWSHGLGDRVSWMINQKLNSASIRLDPPSLGKLEIHIQVTEEATKITINAQTAHTRELIENASIRLREMLQEAGYQNVNVDVGQGRNQTQSETQQNASAITKSDENADGQQALDEESGSQTGRFYRPDSLVDYFV